MRADTPPYRAILGFLTLLFAARVAAQLLLARFELPFLPDFDAWHSATMPYPVLLGIQAVMLAVMLAIVFFPPTGRPRPRLGRALRWLGWLYVAVMAVRLVVGVLELSEARWFDGAVSTAFHFVLAAYVVTLGAALGPAPPDEAPVTPGRLAVRVAAYPALMAGGFALFLWLRQGGAPLFFSSYLSVLVSTVGILLHETLAPARAAWRPGRADVVQDGLFVVLVQVALPALLKAAALAAIIALAADGAAPFDDYWPHDAPLFVQITLMLVMAEFGRYWIHRILHTVDPLWRLHAVHHAADKLYTINVGRFHPFDKALQFLGDTLPFLLLGLAPEVFAAYFVLYAINGFYQHSNADLRLGPLNWIIAGPELHRWHHSAALVEAQSNYGNNLIVWDIAFGTRYLPRAHEVGRLGIGNPGWPNGFLAQLRAPFTTPTDGPGP